MIVDMTPYMISVICSFCERFRPILFRHSSGECLHNWLKARLEVNGLISVLAGILVYGAVHLIGLETSTNGRPLAITVCNMAAMAV